MKGWGQGLGGYFHANATEIAATKCPQNSEKAQAISLAIDSEKKRAKATDGGIISSELLILALKFALII